MLRLAMVNNGDPAFKKNITLKGKKIVPFHYSFLKLKLLLISHFNNPH